MSVNKAILMGNVGKDPEVRPVSDSKVANFTLATTDKGYTKADGTQVPERTEWHNIVVWGRMADICEKYIRKGMKLYIEGKIRTRSYEKDGQKRYVTEVFADQLEICERPQQQQAPQPAPAAAPAYVYQQPAPAPQYPPQPAQRPAQQWPGDTYANMAGMPPMQPNLPPQNDDDLPF